MPHRRSAALTRAAIRDEALSLFLRQGYDATPLEQIAEHLHITRPAVLYHFGSKDELLRSIVDPAFAAVEAAVDSFPATDRPTLEQQEALLRALLGALLEHREPVALVSRFTNEHSGAGIGDRVAALNQRIAAALGGTLLRDPLYQVKVVATLAALGGVIGARLHVPLDTPEARDSLIDGLLALLTS